MTVTSKVLVPSILEVATKVTTKSKVTLTSKVAVKLSDSDIKVTVTTIVTGTLQDKET